MTKVGIIGATGYTGIELIRLLMNHSNIKVQALSSVSFEGQDIQDIYPNILKILDLECTNSQQVIEQSDVIKKFINEAFHIENNYIYHLDPCKYQVIPHYIIDECDRNIELLKKSLSN